jgi:hypothetical protein
MLRTFGPLLAVMFWIGVGGAVEPADAANRRGAMIVSPKRNKEVERSQEVIGKLHVPGQPVVLIRSEGGDGTWWIQPAPELRQRGYFRTAARFGNSKSRKGDRFHVVVLVLRSELEAELFKDRESLPDLPKAILKSEQIPVVLGDVTKERGRIEINSAVLKPQQDEKVKRITQMIGRVADKKEPVVLVRVDDSGGLWWVQNRAQMAKGGYFKATVRFGNDSTPTGTKFRLVVVTPRSGREAAELKSGASLAELPDGIPRSKVVTVRLERTDTREAEGAE